MIVRNAEAKWEGDLKAGTGNIKFGSGAYDGPYGFKSRFESGPGTNPEELIAAAHAGCFTMALSAALTKAGKPPKTLHTTAKVQLDQVPDGFQITRIDLITDAVIPDIDDATFQKIAGEAKKGCPISKALAAVPTIELKATLHPSA
jgi:osmotically inducible protein OsmC